MVATVVSETADSLTLQVVIPFNRSMRLGGKWDSICFESGGNSSNSKFPQTV